MSLLETIAATYRSCGLNILPASTQTKRPFFSSWKKYQKEHCKTPINEKVTGLAVVCGAISGNLEIIDFDFQGVDFNAWQEEVVKIGGAAYNDVLKALVVEKTQSGGLHVAYRIETAQTGKNEKLAERVIEPAPGSLCIDRDTNARYINYYGKRVTEGTDGRFIVCTIETRGEGGIAIIAPSNGYKVIQHGWLELPVIPYDVRNVLIKAAQNLNEVTRAVTTRNANPVLYDFNKASDTFDVAQFLREDDAARKLLVKYGWQLVGTYQGKETWRRPGKARGISATVDTDSGAVYVFTSNAAPLLQGATYTPLALLAALEYGGDESSAAADIAKNANERTEQLYSVPFEVVPVDRIDVPELPAPQVTKTIYDIEFPVSCANPGGYLQAVIDYTDAISYREQRALSFAAAFASFGHILARRVAYDSKTSPAVYMVAISPPSSGKGAGIEANSKILRLNNQGILEVANQYESVQAFYDRLTVTGKQFLLQDEFGAWLTCVQQERSTGVRTRLLDSWTEIYSKYNDSILPPVSVRKLQESGGSLTPVYAPAFSLYGVTNFAEFRTAFNGRILKNGFIARCSFVVGSSDSPLRVPTWEERENVAENSKRGSLPKAIVDNVAGWLAFNNTEIPVNATPYNVPITRAAYDILREFSREQDNIYLSLDEIKNTAYKTIVGRAGEHAAKYALVFACSQFGPNENALKIDVDAVKKALDFVQYTHEIYKYLDANEIAEDDEDKSTKDLRRYISSIYEDTIPLAAICRVIRSKRLRDLAIVNLENADILERVTIQQEQDGKRVGRPKQVFKINRKALEN